MRSTRIRAGRVSDPNEEIYADIRKYKTLYFLVATAMYLAATYVSGSMDPVDRLLNLFLYAFGSYLVIGLIAALKEVTVAGYTSTDQNEFQRIIFALLGIVLAIGSIVELLRS